ncbi:MAG: NADPH:quinone oxidoreductase family protein [Abditibacteriales bacterium]|nr:NADPH:quinone oxidoreductase family protein [Abditibacteriales bacterium]MDW8366141.1 NADPH:quinone oxidoreductase family protein [Abditibacteriales bacterium]
MKAIIVHAFGEPEVMKYEDAPLPAVGAGQLLVRVEAAGVNYADTLARRGRYGSGRLPFTPGFEVCGIVEAVGAGVQGFRVGQRVMGIGSAGYAEYCVMSADTALAVPEKWTPAEGAAFPVQFLTAYFALKGAGGEVKPGQSVLVHAAAGGVGTAAVQMAKIMGAKVFATASADEKLAKVKQLGADVCINYAREDFVPIVKAHTNGRGVDVIVETVGGEVFEKNFECLAALGRVVVAGCASGDARSVSGIQLLAQGHTVAGLNLRYFATQPDLMQEALTTMFGWIQADVMRPIVGESHPLRDAAEAHRRMEARQTFGKIVLIP